jgi:DNA topoisomerase-1
MWRTISIPLYVVPKTKSKVVKELKEALKGASELILATDEDREGESISWHLLQVLNPKSPHQKDGISRNHQRSNPSGPKNCRSIDENLVHAQETRRILDRLYGYTLSPYSGKKSLKVYPPAGCNPSPCVCSCNGNGNDGLLKPPIILDLKATLEKDKNQFDSKLVTLNGQKVANGSDFDADTGRLLPGRQVTLLDQAAAAGLKRTHRGQNLAG